MNNYDNEMEITFKSLSCNEKFARSCVAAFCVQLNPTIDEIVDIKTVISEAVTNCVVHAYPKKIGDITIKVKIKNSSIYITVIDKGVGIADINKAREPFFTTKPNEERSGMGFTVMESFMDKLEVTKNKGGGLVVNMVKHIGNLKSLSVANG